MIGAAALPAPQLGDEDVIVIACDLRELFDTLDRWGMKVCRVDRETDTLILAPMAQEESEG